MLYMDSCILEDRVNFRHEAPSGISLFPIEVDAPVAPLHSQHTVEYVSYIRNCVRFFV